MAFDARDYIEIAGWLTILVWFCVLTWHAQRQAWRLAELEKAAGDLREDAEALRLVTGAAFRTVNRRIDRARLGRTPDPQLYCDQAADEDVWRG